MDQRVYFVGTEAEVAHHAAPLHSLIPYEVVHADQVVSKSSSGDLAIFFSEHFDRFREAIRGLQEKNVATLYLIDGILEWRNAWQNRKDEPACPFAMRPVLCHKVACISQSQASVLNQWGNQGKVEVVGVPRFDPLIELKRRENVENRYRLLIMTAKCPAYTEDQHCRLLASLSDLKSELDNQPGIEPVWRLTAGLENELGIENELQDLTGKELADVLQTVDAVISTPSTAVLESMMLGVPTAVLDYNLAPDYVRAAWKITAKEHFARVINELLNAPADKMFFQEQQLKQELSCMGTATKRLCQLINEMLSVAKNVDSGNDLIFERQILGPVTENDPVFDHRKIYPKFKEFANRDVTVLQAELAHSRREISHRQKQIDQLQSELNLAHEIFDEINNHPVAGPIVRIRQKLIEFFSKRRHAHSQTSSNQS